MGGHAAVAPGRHHVRVPYAAAGNHDRGRARPESNQHDGCHWDRLRTDLRAHCAWLHAGSLEPRLHRRFAHRRRGQRAHYRAPRAAQYCGATDHPDHAGAVDRDSDRGDTQLPWPGHSAADAILGHDARHRAPLHGARSMGGDLPWTRDYGRGARFQFGRRWAA